MARRAWRQKISPTCRGAPTYIGAPITILQETKKMDLLHLNFCLDEMISSYNSAHVRDTIETLLKIHRNIFFNKDQPKYRKLQLDNHSFCEKVWNLAPAKHFMIGCGWTQVDDALNFFPDKDQNLPHIIAILLEHRFIAPQNREWKAETKFEKLHISQKRDEELREKAALEREKELEEFRKDKLYREQLNENIKKQIAEDRRHNKKQFTKPVVGNKLNPKRKGLPSSGDALQNPNCCTFRKLGD